MRLLGCSVQPTNWLRAATPCPAAAEQRPQEDRRKTVLMYFRGRAFDSDYHLCFVNLPIDFRPGQDQRNMQVFFRSESPLCGVSNGFELHEQ